MHCPSYHPCFLVIIALASLSSSILSAPAHDVCPKSAQFNFWVNGPSTPGFHQMNWWDQITLTYDQCFTNGEWEVQVNGQQLNQIKLFADPAFQQQFDQRIRDRNGVTESREWSGTIDSCGWPDKTPNQAPQELQERKRTSPFIDTFDKGLLPSNFLFFPKYSKNPQEVLDIGVDVVNGRRQNVLILKAFASDSPACVGDGPCHKIVTAAPVVQTADWYGSVRFEVEAKAPAAEGLCFAIWSYHYEEHTPRDCADYSCFCTNNKSMGCPDDTCMPNDPQLYRDDFCPTHDNGKEPCLQENLCTPNWYLDGAESCGKKHSVNDPQFIDSNSFSQYRTYVNHEIDIEIPASCPSTPNVCPGTSCAGLYNTANLNTYQYINKGGNGPARAHMCVGVNKPGTAAALSKLQEKGQYNATSARMTEKLLQDSGIPLVGDGKYHTYSIDWRTGTTSTGGNEYPRADFYVDGNYLGTQTAFVPTRGSRLTVALRPCGWNSFPDHWNGANPGDGTTQEMRAYVSKFTAEPYNDSNDIMYMDFADQPSGCPVPYRVPSCHTWIPVTIPPIVHPSPEPAPSPLASPSPAGGQCSASADRPNGCPCAHSWQCASNWCAGLPSKCANP